MAAAEDIQPTMLDHALALAAMGFHVFPIVAGGRVPAIGGFPHLATPNPEAIRRWWVKRDPVLGGERIEDYNVGIYTGRFGADGKALLVVDVDDKDGKNGSAEIANLDMLYAVPQTLTASTPSGGRHLIYLVDEGLKTGVNVLARGLDTRSNGGYIIAAGSVVEGRGAYRWLNSEAPAPAPQWMQERVGKTAKRQTSSQVIELLDTPVSIRRATEYLLDHAPVAVKGAGGDATTYKVACAVKDLGVSELTALELMSEHYNPRCPPHWAYERLAAKVSNAYHYGTKATGASAVNPDDFEPVAQQPERDPLDPKPVEQKPPFQTQALDPFDDADIPPRAFILGRQAVRKKVTLVIAPPGVGKSTVTIAWALATTANRDDVTGLTVHETTPVMIINNEDEDDELRRRISAVRRHFDISWDQLRGRLFVHSGVERPFLIAKRSREGNILPADRDALVADIKAKGVGLVVVDPFVETHEANENDNGEINRVGHYYRQVAVEANCAVVLVHHTRKPAAGSSEGHAGNLDASRGASALGGVARIVVTLFDMSAPDAKRYGIQEAQRPEYVRLDDAKANLSLRSSQARWFRKVGVRLGNGDDVGVLAPVELHEAIVEQEAELFTLIAATVLQRGEVTVNEMATIVLREGVSAYLGDSKDKVSRDLKKRLATPVCFDNCKFWYEDDERTTDTGKSRHWIFGHTTAVAEESQA